MPMTAAAAGEASKNRAAWKQDSILRDALFLKSETRDSGWGHYTAAIRAASLRSAQSLTADRL